MISLEMVGYYDADDGSQSYPSPFLRWFYPLVLGGTVVSFTPPSPEERAVALGPTAELPEPLSGRLSFLTVR